jgi:hypothetical protein
MTDTDQMDELQAAAHKLRDLAASMPAERMPIEVITENFRSARVAVEAFGVLLTALGTQIGDLLNDSEDYVTRVKNPADAATQLTAVHAVTANVVGAMPAIAGALQAAETALARVEPAPPVDLFDELDKMADEDDD